MGLKRSQVHLGGLLLIVALSHAQLDRPGPPYPDGHHNNAVHQESSADQWRNQGGRYPPRNQERLPSLSPNILKTLYRALGPGVPVESPTESAFRNQNNFHSYYLQSPQSQPEHNPEKRQPYRQPERYNAVEQSGVQTAHVYIPYNNKDYTQRPMPNVLVKYHAQGKTYENIQQYSQPDPVVQIPQYPQPDHNAAMVQAVQVHQYSQTQPEIQQQQQYSQHQPIVQQYSQNQPIVQKYPSVQQQQQQAPLVKQESQTASPSHFAINFQLPPKKHRSKKRPHHHHVKSYTYRIKSKGKHIQAYPIFTTLGKGLDGLNAVRRGVKKGTGQVVATGVKLGGKLAYVGAGVVAKVIKAASSI